ncbi:tyrosine-type recombinase/integrase [Kallotenue papyrolyticum]|uniref:tyrosine-type recombinase/integrase n=1 Tax=Kallotenue papyrolyticum TaxID=1325125 RepID=UPI00046FE07B|nr:tyrosine-type recombinase/integrase [Kallotenue papyrolyticum]
MASTSLAIAAAIAQWLADLAETRSPETVASYTYTLRSWQRWLVSTQPQVQRLDQLTTPLLRAYVEHLAARRLDDRTLHHHVGVLTRWLDALINSGELAGIPNQRGRLLTAAGVRAVLTQRLPRPTPPVAPRVPNLQRLPAYYDAELRRFLTTRATPPTPRDPAAIGRHYLNLLRNRALIGVLFSTGARINEVLQLDVAQVQRQGVIVDAVRLTGKGRKRRAVYLNAPARAWLAAYLQARSAWFPAAPALFISHGPRGRGARLSDVSAWKIVKEAAEALAAQRQAEGAPEHEVKALLRVSPHSLRHFLAQAMLDEGADYKDLTAILGHSSAVVTEQYYARLGDERVLEIVETFAPRPATDFDSPPSRRHAARRVHDEQDDEL